VKVAIGAEVEGVLLVAGSVVLIVAVTLRAVQISCTRVPNSGNWNNQVSSPPPVQEIILDDTSN
jgi:hypothetical protein